MEDYSYDLVVITELLILQSNGKFFFLFGWGHECCLFSASSSGSFFSNNPSGDAAEKFALSLTCSNFSFLGELLNLVRLSQIDPGDL